MDIFTQALLGGVLAQSVSNRSDKKIATVVGMSAGLLADADILISSSTDPLLNLEYHRHFSHSLLFIPLGALIAFLLLLPFLRNKLSLKRLYLYCFIGYSMSGLLDACTSYGTHLLWPFSDERIAWNVISIIDPIFSLILLISLLIGLRIRSSREIVVGILLALLYLGFGVIQKHRVETIANDLILQKGHVSIKQIVKPTIGNLILWRHVYAYDGRLYVNAIRAGIFSEPKVYDGNSVKLVSLDKHFPGLDVESALYSDIKRFILFSDGYVAFDPSQPNVLGDIRYSMLPTSVRPLWGIVIDPEFPQQHASYEFFRNNTKQNRSQFFQMLFGSEIYK